MIPLPCQIGFWGSSGVSKGSQGSSSVRHATLLSSRAGKVVSGFLSD